ncbi:TPA: DUF378 domain-containing protein [archaeon]|jgi:uncharacterized membrane protein YuzA (DUF378 family)|uniref:DUF378 domain-containing protein n=1 Tax=Candidatus Undinarchaeum marinum TaxID=2756141 RepID=A0A832V8W0_9ARCH|nr:DUF378 domain-containing protein [Candidatus Undinarchaeum marinum]
MAKNNRLDMAALGLVILGGLNWGLIAAFQWDFVDALLGSLPTLQRLLYLLVGLSALYMLYNTVTNK